MPGTPDPVLGSQILTHAVASAVGLLLVSVVYATRERIARGWVTPLLIGVGYAAATLSVWTAVRVVADAFPSGFVEYPVEATGFVVAAFVVLVVQFASLATLYARRGLVVPLVGLFGVTELVWWAFLHVRGETDALGMFVFFGPMFLGVVLLFSGMEYVVRRVWNGRVRGGSRSSASDTE